MTDKYEALKAAALAASYATPWYYKGDLLTATIDDSKDATYIAAASPDVVLALIAERDALAAELESLQESYGQLLAANVNLAAKLAEMEAHPMCDKHPRYSTYPLCPDCELEKEAQRRAQPVAQPRELSDEEICEALGIDKRWSVAAIRDARAVLKKARGE